MDKEKRSTSYLKLTILIVVLLAIVLGCSYAFLTLSLAGEKTNNIVVGNLSLKLGENTAEGIDLKNAYPVSDETGLTYQPYSFNITNTGNIDSAYTIYLDDEKLDSKDEKRMNEAYVKYSLVKNGVRNDAKKLTAIKTDLGRVLDTGILSVGQTNEYDLRLWIDISADNEVMKSVFSGRIRIEAEQIKE